MGTIKLGNRDHHHLIFQVDEGFPFTTLEVPSTLEEFIERSVGWCADTHVNILDYHMQGDESKDEVGEGAKPPYTDLSKWRHEKHSEHFQAQGVDTTEETIKATHKAGMAFFAGIRVNDVHHCARDRHPRFWADHPEFHIGEDCPVDARWKGAQDFAHPEVREYRKDVIQDVLDRWDVDGVELDFNRMPTLFKSAEVDANRDRMTVWIGEIKDMVREAGERRGHLIPLEVRLPSVAEVCYGIGIDILRWIREELVDIATFSGIRYAEFEMPIKECVKAAEGTNVLVFAGFEPRSPSLLTVDMWRAVATHYWKAGVDGLHIFNAGNYYYIAGVEMPHLKEMTDPELMARRDKKYQVTRRLEWSGSELPQFTYPKQLPCPLKESTDGTGSTIRIQVDDDISGARGEGSLAGLTLRIRINNITPLDDLEVTLNGSSLPKEKSRTDFTHWGIDQYPARGYLRGTATSGWRSAKWIEFDVTEGPDVRTGENEVEVILGKKNEEVAVELDLENVEVLVTYV